MIVEPNIIALAGIALIGTFANDTFIGFVCLICLCTYGL